MFPRNWSNDTGLKEGNATFGRQHIAKGGSTGNTQNHELTAGAKGLWVKALDNVEAGSYIHPFPGGSLSTNQYGADGAWRTMCVLVDDNDYTYSGTNYGPKGIITAYWVNGRVGPNECSTTD